jgi:hypothetical protein
MTTLRFHLVLVMPWLTVNTEHISGIRPFDPSPFSLLGSLLPSRRSFFQLHPNASESDSAPRGASGSSKSANGLVGRERNHDAIANGRAICRHMGLQSIVVGISLLG